jgi:hypothetical protein
MPVEMNEDKNEMYVVETTTTTTAKNIRAPALMTAANARAHRLVVL